MLWTLCSYYPPTQERINFWIPTTWPLLGENSGTACRKAELMLIIKSAGRFYDNGLCRIMTQFHFTLSTAIQSQMSCLWLRPYDITMINTLNTWRPTFSTLRTKCHFADKISIWTFAFLFQLQWSLFLGVQSTINSDNNGFGLEQLTTLPEPVVTDVVVVGCTLHKIKSEGYIKL